jgi:hypothetical protein
LTKRKSLGARVRDLLNDSRDCKLLGPVNDDGDELWRGANGSFIAPERIYSRLTAQRILDVAGVNGEL